MPGVCAREVCGESAASVVSAPHPLQLSCGSTESPWARGSPCADCLLVSASGVPVLSVRWASTVTPGCGGTHRPHQMFHRRQVLRSKRPGPRMLAPHSHPQGWFGALSLPSASVLVLLRELVQLSMFTALVV